jgi:phosphate transport system substrate-binding protein
MLLVAQLGAFSLNGLLTYPTWAILLIVVLVSALAVAICRLQVRFNREGECYGTEYGFQGNGVSMRLGGMLFMVTLVIFFTTACDLNAGPSAPTPSPPSNCNSGRIAIGGSTAIEPLVSASAQMYKNVCDGADIMVNKNVVASLDGLSEVAAGNVDIATSDLLSSRHDLVDHPVAVVIYVLVLNRSVSVTNLTSVEIQGIYDGSITNWSQVGGPDLPISVVSRTSTSGTRKVFEDYILGGPESLPLGSRHFEGGTTRVVAEKVANTSGAIGYVDLGTALRQNLPRVRIDGVEASSAMVMGEQYPFWTVVYMYTRGIPSGLTKAFLDYITGDKVRATTEGLSYIPFNDILFSGVINNHPSPIAPGGL